MIQPRNDKPRLTDAVRRWVVPAVGLATFAFLLLPFALSAPRSNDPAAPSPGVRARLALASTDAGPGLAGAVAGAGSSPIASRGAGASVAASTLAPSPAGSPDSIVRASASPSAKAASAQTRAAAVATIPSDGKRHLIKISTGHRLAMWCMGTGTPTVILEHGLGYGVDSDSWEDVQEGLAVTTRVCRYDRAFVGDSDDGKSGRSMPDLAEDLHELLKASGLTGPFVLVGHSFGGLSVRYYALRYGGEVAGMVLVDGSAPYAIEDLNLGSERLNHAKVMSQLDDLKRLGSIPLVVITRGIGAGTKWRAAQLAMVKLSTRGRQVIATKSDHWIQLRQPDLVIRQVQTVVNTIRRRA